MGQPLRTDYVIDVSLVVEVALLDLVQRAQLSNFCRACANTAENVNLRKTIYLQKFDFVGVASLEQASGTEPAFLILSSFFSPSQTQRTPKQDETDTVLGDAVRENLTEATAVNRI